MIQYVLLNYFKTIIGKTLYYILFLPPQKKLNCNCKCIFNKNKHCIKFVAIKHRINEASATIFMYVTCG